MTISAILAALACCSAPLQAPAPNQAEELARWAETRDERMAWWRDARFGMFVHFGLYSAAGGKWDGKVYEQHYAEWIQHWAGVPCTEYARTLKPLFRPEPGFADAWAELAADAGMRYAVMTSKHHDGFTLFESKQSYSLDDPITGGTNVSPKGRDVAREFVDALRKRGLRAGFYYSLLDWQHPDAYEMALPAYPREPRTREHARYLEYVRAHVNELATNYGELCTLWFDYSDAERQGEAWGAARLLADLRAKQPHLVVNNRLFLGLENTNGDYGTPEKYVPPTGIPGMDWEVNHTLNESYGYSSHDEQWKDTTTVVRLLCDVVSKGGNLLLNIGPDAHGRVPEAAQKTLRGVGAWMRSHGEAIYGTRASPFTRLTWGRATQKDGVLYLLVFDWPRDGKLVVPLTSGVKSAHVLGEERELAFAKLGTAVAALEITVPQAPRDPACTVVKLELSEPPVVAPFVVQVGADGVLTLVPHDATLAGPSLRVEQVGAVEDVKYNLGYWLDPSATATWPIGVEPAQAGEYRVEAEIACADASAGARVALELPGGALEFTAPATGGWQNYRVLELGRTKLAAGSSACVLRAKSKPGEAVVNVRSLRFVRITK
ncbi:MAG: alpha-L-fucosidase [Planctomycetes bacterium]|nr:alpha-L-fucosidase [Planctomycetota bacterium]